MNVQTPKSSLCQRKKRSKAVCEVDEKDSYTSPIVEDYYCKLYLEEFDSAISLDSIVF